MAHRLVVAGAAGIVVDWERRGKRRRQAGADTQINADTPDDLAAVRAATGGRLVCRVNGWDGWTPAEIDLAIALGADEVLLPMVRRVEEVDAAVAHVAGRCGLGILIETTDAVRRADELLRRPLARVYVGMNDLMIDRGCGPLFAALVDGTVDRLAALAADAGIPFGVGGLTVPEGGHPVPCRLLAGELARLARVVHLPPALVPRRHRRPRPRRRGPPHPGHGRRRPPAGARPGRLRPGPAASWPSAPSSRSKRCESAGHGASAGSSAPTSRPGWWPTVGT